MLKRQFILDGILCSQRDKKSAKDREINKCDPKLWLQSPLSYRTRQVIYRVNALPHDGDQMSDMMMVLARYNSGTRDKQQTWRQTDARHASSLACGREDSSEERRKEQNQIMRDVS
jgi:hypothetical protein